MTRQPDDDDLRAAMDRVRGVGASQTRPVQATGAPDAPAGDGAAQAGASPGLRAQRAPRRIWDIRGRLSDDLARVPTPAAAAWPAPVAGLVAGLWAAAMSWLLFAGVEVLAWVFAPLGSGTLGDVMRASGATWVVANAGAITWQGATLSLPPLGATAVIVLFQRRAGGWLVNASDATDPRRLIAPYAFGLGAAASAQVLVAATIANGSLVVPLGRSALGAVGVAALGFGWGIWRAFGLAVPQFLAAPLVQARRFLLTLGLVAVLLLLASAVTQRQAFVDVLGAVADDTTSKSQVLLLCAAYLPTLIVWVVALLLGPGFTLGLGTTVTLHGVDLGALPPIPLLALIPDSVPDWAPLLLIVPFAGALAAAGVRDGGRWSALVGVLLTAVGAGVVGLMASGGMGPGRLAQVGPTWWLMVVVAAVWMAAGWLVRWAIHAVRARIAEAPDGEAEAAGKLTA